MSQKEMCLEIAKPRKPQKLRKRPVAHRLDFKEGKGKKVPKVSEISSTKQNWEFSAELHKSASETLATVPNTDTLFFLTFQQIRTFASGKFLLRLASAPRLAQRVSPHAAR
jgi:hypothetical protein